MQSENAPSWQHHHVFNQDQKRDGESRTLIVVIITAVMMLVEIATGLIYNSMALLADGLHMASHTAALGLALFAYVISRRLAGSAHFSFGVGKISSLTAFTSAMLLLGFALLMASESIHRFFNPLPIDFNKALAIAVVGLVVNALCAWILSSTPDGHHHHGHSHGHSHSHSHSHSHDHSHCLRAESAAETESARHHDHNLRAAHLHVLADALTSLLAIVALLMGKYLGANWMDPMMGIVGAVLVARWSVSLLRDTAGILLDRQAPRSVIDALIAAVQGETADQVADVHIWRIGDNIYAAEFTVISSSPSNPDDYKERIPEGLNIVHATVEVYTAPEPLPQ